MIAGIIVAVIVVVAVIAWAYWRKRRSQELRQRFGPEYQRAVQQHGDPRRAEAALEEREKRVEKLRIRRLPEPVRARYVQQWQDTQRHFVDDPQGAVHEADRLVSDVMTDRGYPMADFDRRSEDISVDHPRVVQNYRAAHDIVLRHKQGAASTEDLRKAMVHYRSLFDDLLEAEAPERSREIA